MEEKTVYIKPELSSLVENTRVTLSDVAQVYAYDEKLAKEVGAIEVLHIQKKKKQKTAMSVLRLVRLISDYRYYGRKSGRKGFYCRIQAARKDKTCIGTA